MNSDSHPDITIQQALQLLNTAIQREIRTAHDSILAAKSAADLTGLELALEEFATCKTFLKACGATITRFCDEQRELLDERAAELEHNKPDQLSTYLCTMPGSMLAYRPASRSRTYAELTEQGRTINQKAANSESSVVASTKSTHIAFQVSQYAQQKIQLPLAINAVDIRPALHIYQQNIYLCVYPGLYCRVPFPVTIDTNAADDRRRTVRCRAVTRQACNERRKHAQYTCRYAHCGEPLVKVSSAGRCLSCPQFGNAASWAEDLEQITERDARTILMYGLSDVMAVACWAAAKKITGCWTELDIA